MVVENADLICLDRALANTITTLRST